MVNRQTKRALKQAGIPEIPAPGGADSVMARAMTAVLLYASSGECDCKACKAMRKVIPSITDQFLEEDENEE